MTTLQEHLESPSQTSPTVGDGISAGTKRPRTGIHGEGKPLCRLRACAREARPQVGDAAVSAFCRRMLMRN